MLWQLNTFNNNCEYFPGLPFDSIQLIREVGEVAITLSSFARSSILQVRSDQFVFEETMKLISEIFVVECIDTKSVDVKMQHCAVIPAGDKNISTNIKFAICEYPDYPPYKFKLYDGRFLPRAFVGEITMSFSTKFVAICQKIELSHRHFEDTAATIEQSYGMRYFAALFVSEDNEYKTEAYVGICQCLEGKKEVQ